MNALEAAEIDAVLAGNGLGVLAFDGGPQPYPVPVAYGYEAEADLFVVQLEGGADSYKHRCLAHNPNVGFTVYEETEPGRVWRSVIVQGTLVESSYQETESAFATLARNTQDAPNPVLWDGATDSTDLTPYELDVRTRSGREFVIE
jgi:nitroimidazol reductase NimA-like FMN-containing flavoprotein (pyridoxamine 5'-phosphate oxidase superfamily)